MLRYHLSLVVNRRLDMKVILTYLLMIDQWLLNMTLASGIFDLPMSRADL